MSHAQAGEDNLVMPYLAGIQQGYAVDVGAADGIVLSNTLLYEEQGWHCLCIEPNPYYYAALSRNRQLTMPYAVSNKNAELVPFHVYDRGGGDYIAGTGFIEDIDYLVSIGIPVPQTTYHIRVPTRTLDYCLEAAAFPRVDFVSIDTEGHDMEVLAGFDIRKWRPLIVIAEDWHDQPISELYFTSAGYRRIARVIHNNIYLREAG